LRVARPAGKRSVSHPAKPRIFTQRGVMQAAGYSGPDANEAAAVGGVIQHTRAVSVTMVEGFKGSAPTAFTTASIPPESAARSVSSRAIFPTATWAGCSFSRAGSRTNAVTSCLATAARRTTSLPTRPVAPNTKTRIPATSFQIGKV